VQTTVQNFAVIGIRKTQFADTVANK